MLLSGDWLSRRTSILARLFAATCLLMALAELIFGSVGIGLPLLLLAAAVLVATGFYASGSTSPWIATLLLVTGAMAGGLALVWTIIGPISAVVLIVLTAIDARRTLAPTR
jgi:hypothetical protein